MAIGKYPICWWTLLSALMVAASLHADPIARQKQTTEVGPVRVIVETSPSLVALTSNIELDLILSAPEDVSLEWPVLAKSDLVHVLDHHQEGPDTVTASFGRLQMARWRVTLQPKTLGKLELPPLTVRYKLEGEDWKSGTIAVPAFDIVPSTEAGDNPQSLRPIPKVDMPAMPSFDAPHSVGSWLKIGGVLVLIAVAGYGIFSVTCGCKSLSRNSLRQLDVIANSELFSPRARIEAISQLIRDYLQSRYQLAAPKQSTPEFLRDAEQAAGLAAPQQQRLASFLAVADVGKFAPREPTGKEAKQCLEAARDFLRHEPAS